MLAAAHLDNFLFLLFIAVAIFFQLLTRAASKGRRSGGDTNRRPTSAPSTPRSAGEQPEETEEDRVRKFLEALGQPTTSRPPPPVVRRPTYQKPVVLPKWIGRDPTQLPPLTTRPPDLPPELTTPREFVPKPGRRVFQPKTASSTFEVQVSPRPMPPIIEVAGAAPPAIPRPISTPGEAQTDIKSLLKTSSGLRNAMILREIFGPPRSLQPLDLVGNV